MLTGESLSDGDDSIDVGAIGEGLERLRGTCQRFVNTRSALTEVTKSVTKVSEGLGEMRDEVLAIVDDLIRSIRRTDAAERARLVDQVRRAG
jgi:hypothetical protein